jgi:hypothetical protein
VSHEFDDQRVMTSHPPVLAAYSHVVTPRINCRKRSILRMVVVAAFGGALTHGRSHQYVPSGQMPWGERHRPGPPQTVDSTRQIFWATSIMLFQR